MLHNHRREETLVEINVHMWGLDLCLGFKLLNVSQSTTPVAKSLIVLEGLDVCYLKIQLNLLFYNWLGKDCREYTTIQECI